MKRAIGGAVLAVLGAALWIMQGSSAAACRDPWITALDPSDCQRVTVVHDVGGLLFLGGVALLAWGLWHRSHMHREEEA